MNKKKQTQLAIGGGILALLLVVVGGVAFSMSRNKSAANPEATPASNKKKISAPVNQIEVSERPYVQIVPYADGHNLDLIVESVPKSAESAEYELEYQAGTLLQGAFGLIELNTVPATTKILLGSCSAGGSCTYHEDVKGGSLVLHFSGPEEYSLKQEWRYFDNWGNNETAFASKDAKFQIESAALGRQRFIVVYNSPGYPKGVEGTIVSEPYSLTTSSTLSGTGELTIRATEEGDLAIMGYNGSTWQEFETTSDGKAATATVDLMELYVVVKK